MTGDAASRKVAFITGAGSGIGRAAAQAFLRRGYATVLADVNEQAGQEAQGELGALGECIYVRCDVADDDTVRAAVDTAVAAYGRLDAAFNAAGIDGEQGKLVAESSLENWNRVIAVDLTGTWSCMRYQLPALLASGGGAIVNCASVAGIRAAPTVSAYTAAKHGVVGLTRAAAREYASRGVRVNALCPGTVDTPMFRASMSEETIERLIRANPSGRVAEAREIADTAVWLCTDAPAYLTGQAIAVDGAAGA
ncbi:SDR family oxidoreductase [Parafrankia sp. EUN1f]|uniref:SDR family oxidoreductase n=1 Tax=Parafrankia sp. EUN1f TaxID=102897 RepID=UPI0001C442F0|nr:SDR family oxidoreductase [Parafrankia sp. EUN1f]EFC84552.1 short-chain dehydrogenase/reductase SDR [Parafrankia sp. EUN1f]